MILRDPGFAARLLASMRSGIIAIDATGALAAINDEAIRILGRPGESAWLGRPCREVLAAHPSVAKLLLDALDGRERPVRAELALDPPGGSGAHTIGFSIASIRDDTGRVDGAALLFRDLTPYERQDEQERLRERLAALGQMAAGLAHEIRNPLASMEVLTGLLKRELERRPETCALVDELQGELRALAATVTESLEFVRPAEPARANVDPVAVLEESLAQARARVPFAGEIARSYAEDYPPLFADGEQLRAAITNLIVNALEAMAARPRSEPHRLRLVLATARDAERSVRLRGGELEAAPEEKPASVVLSVSDTGSGIPHELRERIFYPFFTTKQRGSGVGLAHAQKIAASHGGTLELETREGEGSRFTLQLPAACGDTAWR